MSFFPRSHWVKIDTRDKHSHLLSVKNHTHTHTLGEHGNSALKTWELNQQPVDNNRPKNRPNFIKVPAPESEDWGCRGLFTVMRMKVWSPLRQEVMKQVELNHVTRVRSDSTQQDYRHSHSCFEDSLNRLFRRGNISKHNEIDRTEHQGASKRSHRNKTLLVVKISKRSQPSQRGQS